MKLNNKGRDFLAKLGLSEIDFNKLAEKMNRMITKIIDTGISKRFDNAKTVNKIIEGLTKEELEYLVFMLAEFHCVSAHYDMGIIDTIVKAGGIKAQEAYEDIMKKMSTLAGIRKLMMENEKYIN